MELVKINGSNYFNDKDFENACKELESGNVIGIFISCIGHTRAIIESNNYMKALREKYGNRLIEDNEGCLDIDTPKLRLKDRGKD